MDMVFRDDESRVRTNHAPTNFTTIKHMACNLLRRPSGKDSMRVRRKVAGWDDEFLASLITAWFFHPIRLAATGPYLPLRPQVGVALVMVFHELATNAAKYGALSTSSGTLTVTWCRYNDADGERIRVLWIEGGGPKVLQPARRGFGTRLIERSTRNELGGEARLEYLEEGFRCELTFPWAAVAPHFSDRRSTPWGDPKMLTGLRILVVEDETMVGMMLEDMLLDFGCRVEVVSTIESALIAIRENVPDGVLLDMNLNGQRTVAVAEVLAERSVPFLLVTGYGGGNDDPPIIKTAPRLQKPFTEKDLNQRMLETFASHWPRLRPLWHVRDRHPKAETRLFSGAARRAGTRQSLAGNQGCSHGVVAITPVDRDRGTPHGAAPPTPPGIRVTYHGGSIGLSVWRDIDAGETEWIEVVVAQGCLDRRVPYNGSAAGA
jgi:CheY-like chemotaxis protein